MEPVNLLILIWALCLTGILIFVAVQTQRTYRDVKDTNKRAQQPARKMENPVSKRKIPPQYLKHGLNHVDAFVRESGASYFACFGTLLQLVRNTFHEVPDDDLDFAVSIDDYRTILDAAEEADMITDGIHTKDVFLRLYFGVPVDFYVYEDKGDYLAFKWHFYSARTEGEILHIPKDFVLPLCSVEHEGRLVMIPNRPIEVVRYLYGDRWRERLPRGSYFVRVVNHVPVVQVIDATHDDAYWDQFYGRATMTTTPSNFAQFIVQTIQGEGQTLLDAGCGNARDTVYLSQHGFRCTGIDGSSVAIRQNIQSYPSIEFQVGDFTRMPTDKTFDVLYLRWVIHSIDDDGEARILTWAATQVRTLCVEVRTIHDPLFGRGEPAGPNAFNYGHYRRFINPNEFVRRVTDAGFTVTYQEMSDEFSMVGDDRPHLLRLIGTINAS